MLDSDGAVLCRALRAHNVDEVNDLLTQAVGIAPLDDSDQGFVMDLFELEDKFYHPSQRLVLLKQAMTMQPRAYQRYWDTQPKFMLQAMFALLR
jgi:hypothetical protein